MLFFLRFYNIFYFVVCKWIRVHINKSCFKRTRLEMDKSLMLNKFIKANLKARSYTLMFFCPAWSGFIKIKIPV
jgi:hypothetical protein